MKYKVGDKVRVISILKAGEKYGDKKFTKCIEKYRGEVVTISKVYCNRYCIKEDCEGWYWTDEMFEGLAEDELTVEEAIKIQAEMCRDTVCSTCKLSINNNDMDITCSEYCIKYPERVVEVLKQWKKDHEKKEVETERAIMVRVLVGNDCNGKCVHEEEVPSGETWEQAQERVLKEYCENHEGKYISTICGICRVKE